MRYSEEEKAMWIQDWKQSEKSAFAYSKENGLNLQTFKNWIKNENNTEQELVEVPTQVLAPFRNNHEILIEKGDVRIHIPLSAGCSELRAVMEGLGGVL